MKTLSNPYLATLWLSMTAQAAVADRLIDPTRPASRGPVAGEITDTLRVEAILRSSDRHLAIVNGKVVRAGDRVGTAQITEVLPDGIRYTRGGETRVAHIDQRSIQVRQNVAKQASP